MNNTIETLQSVFDSTFAEIERAREAFIFVGSALQLENLSWRRASARCPNASAKADPTKRGV
jgi:hypothetical protein